MKEVFSPERMKMAFKDIVGNQSVKRRLSKSLRRRQLPNSMLFTGPEGVGKEAVALIVAKALNCLKKSSDACEECLHCRAVNTGTFPDVLTVSPEGNALKIDQMRLLKDTAYLKPMAGEKRVFLVTQAEKMTEEAANSLLKVLEEPPSFSHIILITSNPYRIIPTITSRCQVFSFSPLSGETIRKVLEKRGYPRERALVFSRLVRGNLRRALESEWEGIQKRRQKAWEVLQALLQEKKASFFLTNPPAKEELEDVFTALASFFRDILLLQEGGDDRLLLNPDYSTELRAAARSVTSGQTLDLLDRVDYALSALGKNLNVNILMSSVFSETAEGKHV